MDLKNGGTPIPPWDRSHGFLSTPWSGQLLGNVVGSPLVSLVRWGENKNLSSPNALELWGSWLAGLEHVLYISQGSAPLFPQVKPVVSQFLREKKLPYNEDSYGARFHLFLSRYEELMVQAPPITELVGLQ